MPIEIFTKWVKADFWNTFLMLSRLVKVVHFYSKLNENDENEILQHLDRDDFIPVVFVCRGV